MAFWCFLLLFRCLVMSFGGHIFEVVYVFFNMMSFEGV